MNQTIFLRSKQQQQFAINAILATTLVKTSQSPSALLTTSARNYYMVEIGNRYGLLVVLRKGDPYINPRGKVGESRWVCRCDCGKEKLIYRSALTTGRTKSCGCLVKKSAALRCANNGKPRQRKGAYSSWAQMKSRCNNPETPGYKNYGGRGGAFVNGGIHLIFSWKTWERGLTDAALIVLMSMVITVKRIADGLLTESKSSTPEEREILQRTGKQ